MHDAKETLRDDGGGKIGTLAGVIASQVLGIAECHTQIAETKDTVQAILDEFTSVKSEVSQLNHGLREVQVNNVSITSYQAGIDDVTETLDRLEGEIHYLTREARIHAQGGTLTNIR